MKKTMKAAMKRKKPSEDVVPPTVAVTHSAVLNVVLSEKRTGTSLSSPNIAENMLKAVQTATLSAPIGTKRKTITTTVKNPRLRPTTTTQARSSTKIAKVVPKAKIPRVIGKEIDIRNQLLSKFTEVAAAKSKTNEHSVKKKRLTSISPLQIESNNGRDNIQSPTSSQENAKIDSKNPTGGKSGSGKPKTPKSVTPKPRFRLSSTKPCRQNIAFADPGRKVANVVESMFSSAITKVLNTQSPTKSGKLVNISLNLSKEAQKVPALARNERRSHRLSKKKPSTQNESTDEEESQEKSSWGYADDENSDNYEETAGYFDNNDVKIEIVSDQQDEEYDYGDQSDLANLHGHQVVDMIVEDVQEEDEADPLTERQTGDDMGIVKVENSGTGEDDQCDVHSFFGGESTNTFENEEPEQVTVDVKPHLLPEIEMETDGDDEVEEPGPLEAIIKTENVHEDEYNDD